MSFPNKFPKSCRVCNKRVEAYAGLCIKSNGGWVVEHVDCNKPNSSQLKLTEEMHRRDIPITDEEMENHPAFRWMDQDMEESLF